MRALMVHNGSAAVANTAGALTRASLVCDVADLGDSWFDFDTIHDDNIVAPGLALPKFS